MGACDGDMKLPEDASAYDRGVVEGGLRVEERDLLVRQRRALEALRGDAPCDAESLVSDHKIDIAPARWAEFVADLRVEASDQAVPVSRGDVTEVARQCRQDGNWLPLLVTSFAWGWGNRGFGPARLSWVLEGNGNLPGLSRGEVESRLAGAIDVLDRQSARDSYLLLLSGRRIPALGPAFFTKFLYFASRAGNGRCPALILDARLARQMRGFWERRAGEPYALNSRSARWRWRGPRWSDYRYQVYRAFLGRAAAQLSKSGERWTPELVELLLFQRKPDDATGRTVSRT